MNYNQYIELGFKRIDTEDSIEFERTGYYGYLLTIDVYERLCIEVCSGSLDKPKVYYKEKNGDCTCIGTTTPEIVIDWIGQNEN